MTDESKALVPVTQENFELALPDESTFDDLVSAGDYFPVIRLMTAASEQVKSGEFPTNHYALQISGSLDDLGSEVECCVFAWRATAMDYTDGFVVAHDPNHPVFKRIVEEASHNPSCTFGPEFLIWVSSRNSFATFYMGSKSARREAPALRNILQRWQNGQTHLPGVLLKAQKIETKKYTWFAPMIQASDAPMSIPTQEQLVEAVEKFMNAPACNVEEGESEMSEGREV